MAFQDGHQKLGGRAKGVPNKLTKELRETLKGLISSELEALPSYLEKLNERDRILLILKMMPYVLPKIEQVHYKEGENPLYDWD